MACVNERRAAIAALKAIKTAELAGSSGAPAANDGSAATAYNRPKADGQRYVLQVLETAMTEEKIVAASALAPQRARGAFTIGDLRCCLGNLTLRACRSVSQQLALGDREAFSGFGRCLGKGHCVAIAFSDNLFGHEMLLASRTR